MTQATKAGLLAVLLLAAGAMFLFRWDLHVGDGAMVRLDRWTGNVVHCAVEKPRAACD